MKLFVHFGIYKAGSSFLQYLCANSRSHLLKEKIYFPFSSKEDRMQKGNISSGNADSLTIALKNRDRRKCLKVLKEWNKLAEIEQCNSVLISSEALVHQIADDKALGMLKQEAYNSGFEQIHLMGFFRDLVDHAVSTFKHRGKSGRISDHKFWIENVYETPALMRNITRIRSMSSEVDWNFRKYEKNSEHLKHAFFKEWLKIECPEKISNNRVNVSATISEVEFMKKINRYYPLVMDYFVQALRNIPLDQKGEDKLLEKSYRRFFSMALKKQNDSIKEINAYLKDDEKLELINEKQVFLESDQCTDLVLSSQQLDAVLERIDMFHTFKGRLILLRRFLRQFIPKSIRRFAKS